jgi:Leucine-rich repeat (LRR) protein
MGEDILTLFGEKMYRNYFSSLPADLQEIEHLTVLNVHSENLRALPCLEKCKNLEEIDLFRCALLEQPRLKNCLSLKRLSLKQQMNRNEEEQFVAISPHLFKEAPNLLYFCASFNFIKSLPESLKCLTQLVELDLHHNAIEELGEEIGSCKALVTLNLWSNKLKKLPSSLRNLQKLQILAVNENELEELNESVTECAGLHELLLNNNRIKALPEGISRLVNLEVLDFEENLVEVVPQSLSSLKKIKEKRLRFSDNPIYLVECPAAVDRFGDPNSKSIKNSLETGSFKLGPRRNKLSCISKSI